MRVAHSVVGVVYLMFTVASCAIATGGWRGFLNLVGGQAAPSDEMFRFLLALALGSAATAGIGFYLLVARGPTRRGWGIALGSMLVVIVIDLLLLAPTSPARIPATAGHFGLLALLFALFIGARKARRTQ